MDALAEDTWRKVAYGPGRNVRFREDAITSHNLFELDQRHSWLRVWAFTPKQESANGADWEWWMGNDAQGWICLRVQAKRLSEDRKYLELEHRVGESEDLQIQLLLDSCIRDARRWQVPVVPLYCFYNGWVDHPHLTPNQRDADWPTGVRCLACPERSAPHSCIHTSLRIHGCTVTSAYTVRRIMLNDKRPYRLEHYLRVSLPWSHLFKASDQLIAEDQEVAAIAAKTEATFKQQHVAEGVLKQTRWLWLESLQWATIEPTDDAQPWEILNEVAMAAPGRRPAPYVSRLLGVGVDQGSFPDAEGPDVRSLAVLEVPRPPERDERGLWDEVRQRW
ncbi:DUF6615 family protein [Kribbella sp. CA-294648]|uniref:DUF6615 family protein n=1 Tax=Kribbella sp. CA-294648 TaxID=3239948 RepID=UPI003D8C3EA5